MGHLPSVGINCLIGPGDSGKSSLLDAIDYCVASNRNGLVAEVPVYGRLVGDGERLGRGALTRFATSRGGRTSCSIGKAMSIPMPRRAPTTQTNLGSTSMCLARSAGRRVHDFGARRT